MTVRRSLAIILVTLTVAAAGVLTTGSYATGDGAKPLSRAIVVQIAKRQANQAISARAPRLKVASAASAGKAKTATVGLSPVAYAVVNADGTVVPAASRGVSSSNVTLEVTSAYCFRNLGFAFKTAMTSPVYTDGFVPGTTTAVAVPGVYGYDTDCDSGAQLEVATSAESGGTIDYAPAAFTIWFYN